MLSFYCLSTVCLTQVLGPGSLLLTGANQLLYKTFQTTYFCTTTNYIYNCQELKAGSSKGPPSSDVLVPDLEMLWQEK